MTDGAAKGVGGSIDFAGLIRAGDCIAWGGAAVEPVGLVAQLSAALERLPPCIGFANVGLTTALDPAKVAGRMRLRAVGGASTNRRFQESGALDVLPVHYGSLPDVVRDGLLRLDVVLVSLAADGAGYNFGAQVDYLADAIPLARVVIAEINDQAPVTFGETAVAADDVDHVVHVSRKLVEMRAGKPGAVEAAIGAHVARLVPDGATIQVGLGLLPDAVLQALAGKRDLGLHTGTMGDCAVDLIEAGVITNRRKPVDTGRSITAGLLGSERSYRFAHRNPTLHLRSPRYTHDYLVHAQIPCLIGINSALEVDLTGQINAEVGDGRHLGMIGGHADFSRGCMRSKGGRGIVAMESTAKGGTRSRIVARLGDGVVTTSRADADIVVTEHGVAELRGRTVSERAKALIAIAQPSFRRELERAAERLV